MTTALVNGRIFTGTEFLDNHVVLIDGPEIIAVVHKDHAALPAHTIDLNNALLAPGFIDTQVNGGGGMLFNDDPSVQTIRKIGQAHRTFGTCGFLPTLISDDLEKVDQAITAVDAAIAEGVPGVLGIHIEGPFLNIDRKGVHDPSKFKQMSVDHVALLSGLKRGKTLVTLAPENATPSLIQKLQGKGVVLAAGHTDASYEITRQALDAGITGFTHLFNAMSQFINREPGVVGAALEDVHCWCGLIVDGHHVSNTALKIALKCKPIEKFMLVTDAMPTVGSSSKSFMLQSKNIVAQNGVCVAEDGTLAGSDLDMAQAVRNAISMLGVAPVDALNMAAGNPADFIGLGAEFGRIAPGYRASFVLLSDKNEVLNTWIDGQSLNQTTDGNSQSRHTRFRVRGTG